MGIGTQLDVAMARAWPAALDEDVGGWTMRFAEGATRRANSVLCIGRPPDLDGAVGAAEHFYLGRGVAPTFLVSDASTPALATARLTDRRYGAESPTWILHRPSEPADPVADGRPSWTIDVSDVATDEWFDAYWAVEGGRRGPGARRVFREVLLTSEEPTRFVTVSDKGSAVSVGQVAVVDEWACVQCLATVPAGRRRGAGKVVVEQLSGLAASLGAGTVFAAVAADNVASLGLFDDLGYVRSHQYRYFIRRNHVLPLDGAS